MVSIKEEKEELLSFITAANMVPIRKVFGSVFPLAVSVFQINAAFYIHAEHRVNFNLRLGEGENHVLSRETKLL